MDNIKPLAARLIAVSLGTLLASSLTAALACSVSKDHFRPSVGERASAATHVAVGVAVGNPEAHQSTAEIRVERWLKGSADSVIRVSGFGPTDACRAEPPRKPSILFLEKDKGSEGFRLSYLSASDAVEEASAGKVTDVIQVGELGLREYLKRKGTGLKVRSIFVSKIDGERLAALESPDGWIWFVRAGHQYEGPPTKVLNIGENTVRLRLLERSLAEPLILELPVEMTDEMCIGYITAVNTTLDDKSLRRFLTSLNSTVCRGNAEYAEWSNEMLFRLMQDAPALFFEMLRYGGREMEAALVRELKHPVHDGINYPAIFNSIKTNISDADFRVYAMELFEPFYKEHLEYVQEWEKKNRAKWKYQQ